MKRTALFLLFAIAIPALPQTQAAAAAPQPKPLFPLLSIFTPPVPPEPPWVNDPPDIWTSLFNSVDAPNPVLMQWPLEDPADNPTFVQLSQPPILEDPFPDTPSTVAIAPFTFTPATPTTDPTKTPSSASARLTPFPARIPFHPSYSGTAATPSAPQCDPANATMLALPEPSKNTVYFFNVCTQASTRVSVGSNPSGVAGTPDGKFLFVSNMGSSNISVIDLTAMSVVATIPLPLSSNEQPAHPGAIAITSDGTRAYAVNWDNIPGSVVYAIDVPNRKFLQTINVGGYPASIAITPDGSQAWAPSSTENNISVIDTLTNTRILTIGQAPAPTGIAFNPTGTRAYVAEGAVTGGALLVIDAASYTPIAGVPMGSLPHTVAVTPTGRHIFVTNVLSDSIWQIDAATNTVVRQITLPATRPYGMAFIGR